MKNAMSSPDYYGVILTVRATGALTFRRIPSAILHISSYPFIPPSTLSGWLRRLYMLSTGFYPETKVKKPDYYVMPSDYHILGAYPLPEPRKSFQIHTTKRQGIRSFNHAAFSRLSRVHTNKEVYQLHTWEYLLVDRFKGFVLHKEAEPLAEFKNLQNFGSKCGKEGYAFLEEVSEVMRFERTVTSASPNTPAVGTELMGLPADMFVAYRHEHCDNKRGEKHPSAPEPSGVKGFTSIWLGWPSEMVEMEYFSDGKHHIPAGMLEVF